MPEQKVTIQDQGPVLRRVEVAAQEWLLLLELGLCLRQLLVLGRVYRITELVEGGAGGLPLVVEHPDLAAELRAPHGLPIVLQLTDLLLVVEDARGPPLVGNAVLVVLIVGESAEVLPNVLEVGDL